MKFNRELYNEKLFRKWRIIYNEEEEEKEEMKKKHTFVTHLSYMHTWKGQANIKFNTHSECALISLLNYFVPYSPTHFVLHFEQNNNKKKTCLPNRLTVLSQRICILYNLTCMPFSTKKMKNNSRDDGIERALKHTGKKIWIL